MIVDELNIAASRRWRVFYTFPRSEMRCEERLLKKQIEVFLPKYTEVKQWKDRKKHVTAALFRSYLFAQVDEMERLQVLQTQGIMRCLAFGGKLAEVQVAEIEQIKIAQKDPKRLTLANTWIPKIGEQVVVVEGPLKGLKGEVLEHRGQTYVIVHIEAIKQAIKVNVPSSWLRVNSAQGLKTNAISII